MNGTADGTLDGTFNGARGGTVDGALEREAKLLREMNESLHALSQPITVLLCALEYGGSAGSLAEMKEMFKLSQEACERLRTVTAGMQDKVREAVQARSANGMKVDMRRERETEILGIDQHQL